MGSCVVRSKSNAVWVVMLILTNIIIGFEISSQICSLQHCDLVIVFFYYYCQLHCLLSHSLHYSLCFYVFIVILFFRTMNVSLCIKIIENRKGIQC